MEMEMEMGDQLVPSRPIFPVLKLLNLLPLYPPNLKKTKRILKRKLLLSPRRRTWMIRTRASSVLNRPHSGVPVYVGTRLASKLTIRIIRITELIISVCAIRLRVFYK